MNDKTAVIDQNNREIQGMASNIEEMKIARKELVNKSENGFFFF